ncbi:hypothetical protein FYK55_05855 [Roseiconus nitratireducens]|uniref:Uncharacterized protein n=1 Tax=Roseiconus nitratireducens TaxID=2605748 RepID=A0A5M6DCF8_9BACT|nr:AtpZ/AtpI family protein [Roseiconus nitratireducens]KAA5545194.1 hypothetical protein FYK55_05855 [Roseiconus nitratireducens]
MSQDDPLASDTKSSDEHVDHRPSTAGRPKWIRLSGAGMELAAVTLLFGGIGLLLDRKFQVQRPVWSAAFGLIGFVLGLIRFIRLALSVSESERMTDGRRTDSADTDSTDQPQE